MSGAGMPPLAARRAALLAIVVPAAVLTGLLALRAPVLTLAALVGVSVLGAVVLHVEWAVLAYVAAEPFNDYLRLLHPAALKALGALVFLAWLLRLATRTRPVQMRHGAMSAAAVLFVALLASTALHPNGSDGTQVVLRYCSYLAVLVVLVDTMRSGLAPRRVAAVFVASCTASSVAGLVHFLAQGGRAGGPVADPNDFAFFLLCAIPLALALASGSAGCRAAWQVATVVLLVGLVATFSRGAVLGLAVVLVYAVAARLVRPATVLAVAVLAGLAVAGIAVAAPQLVRSSVGAKQHIAAQNVDDRYVTWTMAAEMTADSPVLGQGPGGFKTSYDRYVGPRLVDPNHADVAHQMYLDVASELGLLGAGAFVVMLGAGVVGARRGSASGPTRRLAHGVVASFGGTLVAASFLTEQYYLPIWLLTALGVALDRSSSDPAPSRPDTDLAADRPVAVGAAGGGVSACASSR
ncbi:MAG: O-antigen ligase family protein [Marmoricola sp.]